MALGLGLGLQFRRNNVGGFNGLFDQFGYPAFGASMRLLGINYTGGLVRVRAFDGVSDQGTADVMPYLIGSEYWVDLNSTLENLDATATGRGLTTSDTLADLVDAGGANYDGFVTTWYDQSGNANDASQGTASNQPQLVSGGSLLTENGKPSIDFDGISDFLSYGSIGSFSNGIQTFATVKPVVSLYRTLFYNYDGTSAARGFYFSSNAVYNFRGFVTNTLANPCDSIPNNTSQQLINAFHDGAGTLPSDFQLRIDQVEGAVSGSQGWGVIKNSSLIGFWPGGSSNNYFGGNMQELIHYLSDKRSEEESIEDNIITSFNIPA